MHVMDESGKRLAARQFPEGMAGIEAFHQLISLHAAGPARAYSLDGQSNA